MKWMLCLAVSALILTGCSSSYAPGDYYSSKGDKGIVLQADAEGNATLILSLDEASNLASDSAILWAASLGQGWSLPSKDQMTLARKYRSLINICLRNHKQPEFLTGHTFYWTATPCSQSHVYACGPEGVRCYFKSNTSPYYRARAVKSL
jgi:hypothetical protein